MYEQNVQRLCSIFSTLFVKDFFFFFTFNLCFYISFADRVSCSEVKCVPSHQEKKHINIKWIRLKVKQWQSSTHGFSSPSVIKEHFFLGLVATCREHKVTGQKTQRPKHTVQNLQLGELAAHLPKFPLLIYKTGPHKRVFLSVFAQTQQWCSHQRSVSNKINTVHWFFYFSLNKFHSLHFLMRAFITAAS